VAVRDRTHLLFAEARRAARAVGPTVLAERCSAAPDLVDLDPLLAWALQSLSALDREALLLVA
jgi:hypothetical protein